MPDLNFNNLYTKYYVDGPAYTANFQNFINSISYQEKINSIFLVSIGTVPSTGNLKNASVLYIPRSDKFIDNVTNELGEAGKSDYRPSTTNNFTATNINFNITIKSSSRNFYMRVGSGTDSTNVSNFYRNWASLAESAANPAPLFSLMTTHYPIWHPNFRATLTSTTATNEYNLSETLSNPILTIGLRGLGGVTSSGGGGVSSLAFVELTDVEPLVPADGQAVHYNTLSAKWEQTPELKVDSTTRNIDLNTTGDTIIATDGLFSQIASGSASLGSIGSIANVQGQTGLNLASVTGNVLLQAQSGNIDILGTGQVLVDSDDVLNINGDNGVNVTSTAGITISNDLTASPITIASISNEIICQGQTNATLQSFVGNTEVKAISGNVNIVADNFLNLTSTNEQVIITSLTDDVVIKGGNTFTNSAGTITKLTMTDTRITTAIPSYEANMINTSLATKLYVDTNSIITNKLTNNGDSFAGGVTVGTNNNAFLNFKTFGANKFFITNNISNSQMGGYFDTSYGAGNTSNPTKAFNVLVSGGTNLTSGAQGGDLFLRSGNSTGVANHGSVWIQNAQGLNGFQYTGANGRLISTTANYETLVTTDQTMTNKKYVDDAVATVNVGYPLRTDQDKYSFKIRSAGNVPLAGEIMYLDAGNVNQFANLALTTKIRFNKIDSNGLEHMGGFIEDQTYTRFLLNQEGTSLAFVSIKYTNTIVDGGTYWEVDVNYNTNLGTFTDDQAVFFIRDGVIDPDIYSRLQTPLFISAYSIGDNDVAVTTLSDYVQYTGTNYNEVATGFSYSAGQWTSTDTSGDSIIYECTLSVAGYSDVQDTRLGFAVFKNGTIISGSRVISYSKNSASFAEGTNSRSFIVSIDNGDTLDIRGAFIEDNSPSPNPTDITMEEFSFVAKQLSN